NQHQHYDTTSRTEPSQTAPTNDGRTDNDEACNISETPSVPGSSSPLRPTTSAATRTVLYEDVEPVDELYRKSHYHVHSGRMQERLVVMKVFHGPRANALLRETLVFSRRFLHPHILRPVGISSPTSDVPFIVFDGACKISIQNRIASALSDNLQPSIQLGIRIVSGLATGLDYLFSSCEVPPDFSFFKGLELYITGDDNIKISFGPFNPEVDRGKAGEDERLKIFNDLCSEVFKQANHLLYQDVPVEQDPSGSSLFKGKDDNTSTGSTSTPEGSPADNPSVQESSTSRKTRIELAWKTPPQTRATVAFIARHYKQYSETLRTRGTVALQQLPAQSIQKVSSVHHRCSGYRKEEIVLTPHIPESAIISYTAPFLHEICSICGECVQEDLFSCICGLGDDGLSPIKKCSRCSTWSHQACGPSESNSRHVAGHRLRPHIGDPYYCHVCDDMPMYGPGGEFEGDWKPAPGMPGGPLAEEPPLPPEPPVPEVPQARPAWRQVTQGSRRRRREAPPPLALPPPPGGPGFAPSDMDSGGWGNSWATWQPTPDFQPSPPSDEPTLLVPGPSSPGLFGPRSPPLANPDLHPGPPSHDMDPRRQVHDWATWQRNLQPSPPSREPTFLVPDQSSPGLFGPRTPPLANPDLHPGPPSHDMDPGR
ncbi:hypothetical protein K435DRAFT_875881, partial [Dendrothele bispora CBS 962.96]